MSGENEKLLKAIFISGNRDSRIALFDPHGGPGLVASCDLRAAAIHPA